MKHKILVGITLLIGVVSSCQTQHTAGGYMPIPKENRVVLADEEYFKQRYELWVPTENDIREALDAIYRFLRSVQADEGFSLHFRMEVKKIIMNLSRYRVQIVGIILNNRRYIHCNFLHEKSGIGDWKKRLVMIAAGGFWYWYVYYDTELKKVIKIYINGCT